MKVWVVTKGDYSDECIVAIKSNEEAARRLMSKCSACVGTGKNPHFETLSCDYCQPDDGWAPEPQHNWNEPKVFEIEDK